VALNLLKIHLVITGFGGSTFQKTIHGFPSEEFFVFLYRYKDNYAI